MLRCLDPSLVRHARSQRTACTSRTHRGAGGFTLVELVLAVGIVAVLAAAAVPSYAEWLANARLADVADQLASSLALARAEAVKHGSRVNACKVARGTRTCTTAGGWEAGWIVFLDDNANARADAGEPIVRVEAAAPPGITARGNQPVASYVSFTPYGQARAPSGGLQMGTITVCKPGLRGWQVVLASTGRVRTERASTPCP